MSRRSRRLRRPWIPGFWPLLAALTLGGSVVIYYWALARSTHFQRTARTTEVKAAPAAK